MLFEFSFARHQSCSSVSVSRHLSIFRKYSLESKDLAWATKAWETRKSKAESGLSIGRHRTLQGVRAPSFLYSSISPSKSVGRRLCLALRPAGLAFSSGFA